MAELKPCPFCGGKAEIIEDKEWGDCYIVCIDCNIQQPQETYKNKKQAIDAWNKRS